MADAGPEVQRHDLNKKNTGPDAMVLTVYWIYLLYLQVSRHQATLDNQLNNDY